MRLRNSIFYSALMLTGVNLLLRTVGTSFQVYLSGRIGAAGIGLLQLVLSVTSLATTAGMAGIRTCTMYLTAEELGKKRPQNVVWVLSGAIGYSLIISSCISCGIYFGADYLAQRWLNHPDAANALRLYSAFLPVSCLCGVMTGYFTAANRIGTLAVVEIAEQLCSLTVTMLALTLWAGSDPSRACQAVILGGCAGAVLTLTCLVLLRLGERSPMGARQKVLPRLTDTAIPLGIADDLRAGISTLENLMVPKRLALYPGSHDPLALFGTVCGMVFPILMFPCAILFGLTELLIPQIARCNAAGNHSRIKYLMRCSLKLVLLYGCCCAGIEYLLARELGLGLYRSEDAGYYLKLYAPLIVMLYMDIITDSMIKGLGQQKASVRYNILTSAMDVGLLFVLLPKYGMMGYFISFTVTHAINFILSFRRLVIITGQHPSYQNYALCLVCCIAGVMIAALAPFPAAKPPVFLAVFFSGLYLLRVVTKEDIIWLKGIIKGK